MVLLLGSLVYLAAFLSLVASDKSHSPAGFIRRAAHQKGNVKSQQGQQGQQSQQHVELTGTEQDNVCTDLQQKYNNKFPDGYQCSAYDVNKPEVALSTFQTHGIPVAGYYVLYHGYSNTSTYDSSQIVAFACDCNSVAKQEYAKLLSEYNGNVEGYDFQKGQAPYIVLPIFGHDPTWAREYVATGCSIASVTPEFWKNVKFNCGYYDFTNAPKGSIKVVKDFNDDVNSFALEDIKYIKKPYPPQNEMANANTICTQCVDYDPKTKTFTSSSKNPLGNGPTDKCPQGQDPLNQGQCLPVSTLPDWPLKLISAADEFCKSYNAPDSNITIHDTSMNGAYDVNHPQSALAAYEKLGGKIGGVRNINAPTQNDQYACKPYSATFIAAGNCNCLQLTATKRQQLNAGVSSAQHGKDELPYVALTVWGKDACVNEAYFSVGCAIAKVTPNFYKQAKPLMFWWDFTHVDPKEVQIVETFGAESEIKSLPSNGRNQGLVSAPFPPKGSDAVLDIEQVSCFKKLGHTCHDPVTISGDFANN